MDDGINNHSGEKSLDEPKTVPVVKSDQKEKKMITENLEPKADSAKCCVII